MVWIPQAFATICHANEIWWAQILRQGHITAGFYLQDKRTKMATIRHQLGILCQEPISRLKYAMAHHN